MPLSLTEKTTSSVRGKELMAISGTSSLQNLMELEMGFWKTILISDRSTLA